MSEVSTRPRIEPAELAACGLDGATAQSLAVAVDAALRKPAVEAWREISHRILRPEYPFEVHRHLFERTFADWDPSLGPPPAWTPTPEAIAATNVARMMAERRLSSIAELHAWSVRERVAFWGQMIERLGIRLARPYSQLVALSAGAAQPQWLVGAKLNIAESCFNAEPDKLAIVYHDETGATEEVTYSQLDSLVSRVANGLIAAGFHPGDAVAIDMPMTIESVAAYLGIIRAGCVAVSIADSLAAEEVAVRLRLSGATAVMTQDVMLRGGKRLPLYAKVVEAGAAQAIVIVSDPSTRLRPGDLDWRRFLSDSDRFAPYLADPAEPTNILFSSGTTGEPKAIPWTHTTPIKCAVDGYFHQDIQPHDRVAWPTNLGWMMGPWLIYASLVNRATTALYGGAPNGRDFGQFAQDAGVTMLGVIPTLVKTWRASDCMRGLDWSRLTRFSSTGECSNAQDMLYLMSLAGYKPVIEYCGGTELGGGYIGSTMAQPNVPSAFSTPSLGVGLVAAAECPRAHEHEGSEIFLTPPAIGISTRLLHHDHHAVYYQGVPSGPNGEVLRRHGDAMERLPGGYYRASGRVDDTMNLGGIKASSVEIERVLNGLPGVRETAAVAVAPRGGGPSLLWVFAVLQPECEEGVPALVARMQQSIREHLNPLFKIDRLVPIDSLPRTASHKIMRRVLRDQAAKQLDN